MVAEERIGVLITTRKGGNAYKVRKKQILGTVKVSRAKRGNNLASLSQHRRGKGKVAIGGKSR